MADKVKVSALEVNGTELLENTERLLTSDIVDFDNTGKKFNSTDVDAALQELRGNTVLSTDPLVSTLNGNHNITANDSNLHIVSGTATGYSVTLPDATLLFIGRRFEVTNASSETIQVKDFTGAVLFDVIAGDTVILTLTDNGTSAGTWSSITVTSSATGIQSYVITDQTLFTTTSTADALVTGQQVTPVSGRYAVFQNSDFIITQNNRIAEGVIYVGGVEVVNSRRVVQGVGSNYEGIFNTLTQINVNGSQAVDFRVNITSGSLEITGRSLILIRLGAQT